MMISKYLAQFSGLNPPKEHGSQKQIIYGLRRFHGRFEWVIPTWTMHMTTDVVIGAVQSLTINKAQIQIQTDCEKGL